MRVAALAARVRAANHVAADACWQSGKRRRNSMPEDAAALAEAVEAAAAQGDLVAAEVAAEAEAEAAGGLARSSSMRRRVMVPVRKC